MLDQGKQIVEVTVNKQPELIGAFVETALTNEEVEGANALELLQGLNTVPCAFLTDK
jgi:hypothetical protein